MIRCTLKHLAERCAQRGYALEEAMPCVISSEGQFIIVDESHAAYPSAPKPPVRRQPGRVGAELKGLLRRWLGIRATPTCPCNAHAAQMDIWGPDECEARLDEIVGWLEQEAKKRRLPFIRAAARQMVLLAIRRARNAAAK